MIRSARAVLVVAAAAALLTCPAAAPAQQAERPRSIDVTGDGALLARNDAARVVLAARVRRRTAAAALRSASTRIRRVISSVRANGIASADIQTSDVRVSRTRARRGRRAFATAASSVRVVVRDVTRTGATIDAGVRAGATDVRGPAFFISNTDELYRRALVAAFDDARAKAQQLAARAGIRLGRVLSIREGGLEVESVGRELGGPGTTQPGVERRPRTPTRPGRSRIEATVGVSFAVE